MSVRTCLFTSTALIAGAAGDAFAHDGALAAHWCHLGSIEVAGEFHFTPPALITFRNGNPCPQPDADDRNCGQFDDDYFAAQTYSAGYCAHIYQAYGSQPGVHGVMAVVTGPPSFLSDDHHADYDVSQGLEGLCLVCRMGTSAPPDPDPTN